MHIFNVLVLETLGGSADHIFVFTFHNGKPSVALKRSTAGGIQVQRVGEAVVVTVPPKTYPGPDGQFPPTPDARYSFPIEY